MNPVLWVFRKEMKESLKDRRVVIGAFVMPVFFVMLFAQLMGSLERTVAREAKVEITVVGSRDNPMVRALTQGGQTEVSVMPTEKEAKEELSRGRTQIVLVIPDSGSGGQLEVKAVYDSGRPRSLIALSGMRQAVAQANSRALAQTLAAKNIDAAAATPLKLKAEDLGDEQGAMGSTWSNLLPYLIVLWAFYGGMSMVADLVAGEKERKSLETLLLSPVPRRSLVMGKLLALATVCMASGLTSLVGLVLSALFGQSAGSLGFSLGTVAAFVVVLAPLVALYAGMLLLVSAAAKSVRECQTYLALVSFVVMLPAVMSQFVGITGADQAPWVGWTPILNSSMALTQALKNQFDPVLLLQCVGTCGVLGLVAAWAAVRLFDREEILLRT